MPCGLPCSYAAQRHTSRSSILRTRRPQHIPSHINGCASRGVHQTDWQHTIHIKTLWIFIRFSYLLIAYIFFFSSLLFFFATSRFAVSLFATGVPLLVIPRNNNSNNNNKYVSRRLSVCVDFRDTCVCVCLIKCKHSMSFEMQTVSHATQGFYHRVCEVCT